MGRKWLILGSLLVTFWLLRRLWIERQITGRRIRVQKFARNLREEAYNNA